MPGAKENKRRRWTDAERKFADENDRAGVPMTKIAKWLNSRPHVVYNMLYYYRGDYQRERSAGSVVQPDPPSGNGGDYAGRRYEDDPRDRPCTAPVFMRAGQPHGSLVTSTAAMCAGEA